ncbi:MAG: N-acetylmuramoyl-L-alanine amidase [Paludibacteraceae bacterium]|nr:N-acetylmuramoyl-L-alanine amidase [Paludibacteraceae bacterium]
MKPQKSDVIEKLFGKDYERVPVTSKELDGAVFYLVSGHGGPDPGAIGNFAGHELHEDEYAYDVILRLGRQLMMRGAKVHFIIQDNVDGIRDDQFLQTSRRETCMGSPIPLDQVKRLKQRCDKINALYKKDNKGYRRAVFIHLDSRSERKRIDIFLYHAKGSKQGKMTAESIRTTLEDKYAQHQPNRGFEGTVSRRDLFVLTETNPPSIFFELGNIQNLQDQQRFIRTSNREAMAKWIAEGFVKDYKIQKQIEKNEKEREVKKKKK